MEGKLQYKYAVLHFSINDEVKFILPEILVSKHPDIGFKQRWSMNTEYNLHDIALKHNVIHYGIMQANYIVQTKLGN